MSKSKRFRGHKKPLSLQRHESHHSLSGICDYRRVKTRTSEPSSMQPRDVFKICTSMLEAQRRIAAGEFEKKVESLESPKTSDNSQAEKTETHSDAAEKSGKSPGIQPRPSNLKQGFVSRKYKTSLFSPSGKMVKSNQFSQHSKNTYQFHVNQPKTLDKAVEKPEQSPVSKPKMKSMQRRIVSKKGTSSPRPRNRIIGGGSPIPECSKCKDQCTDTITLCKSENNKLEYCTKPILESHKSALSNTRSSRRGSCVSFTEPVAADIPVCVRKCSSSESNHSTAQNEIIYSEPDHAKPVPVAPTEEKISRKKCKKYKRPLIVVPMGEGTKNEDKEEPPKKKTSRCSISSLQYSANSPKQKSYIPYTRSSFHHVDSLNKLRVYSAGCQQRDPSPQSTSCATCPNVLKQLGELTRKVECLEKKQITDIRQELDCLKATIKCLSEKQGKKELEPEPEPKPKPNSSLERKCLSTCQFCQGRNLPILDSFKHQLKESIGNRSCTDVVLSVFLRADNLYHVNLRDLKSGNSLACFLVTDNAIMEVQQLGLFRDILTFSVIDVRNTLKPKNCALGITFELVDTERQKGGSDTIDSGLCIMCKPLLARVLGLPLHRLRHVFTDPAITANYLKKSFKGNVSSIEQI
ncbi:uncharacterized protein LOC110179163 [Drosophila serrata]|uniref:uncharacterized protein LOC110179163 n=1 Tax=Drosophila serrata TaxID=7274 RepID=UPI000A1D3110|nr:uncharacterized protein LOC110179163 [Drosophila serrata]